MGRMWLAVGAALMAGWAGASCSGPPEAESDAEEVGPLAVVQGHVDAFNRHDAEDLLSWVSPAVEWVNVQGSITSVEVRGREMLRDYMATYFEAQPTVQSEIEEAVVTGDYVAVRERASWTTPDGEERSQASLGVYNVRDGLIQRVWYYPVVP
ncbi:MAG: nuclear transport factor 2 family protein [Gammaproteobacteria bacterium]|nr:nuclear transport factor 2 family protein [Gammaproteobacteria bacterium]